MLFDSNIVIYAADPGHGSLRDWMLDQSPAVSAITYIEVFGFPGITTGEERALRAVFAALDVLPVTDAVIEQAAALRRQRRMSLGDAVVAATAVVHRLELATRNVADFRWVAGLTVVDPFDDSPPAP